MLDMSWGEVMLIGGVALIVIGPKELPRALRTLGQITTKVRRMAGEFQHQFNEAIREADLDDIKRDIDGVRTKAESFRPSFNPVDTIRNELRSAVDGKAASEAAPRIEPLESTAPAAIARGSAEAGELHARGGSYDVPSVIAPVGPDESGPVMKPLDRAP